jgi:hypothetical protein
MAQNNYHTGSQATYNSQNDSNGLKHIKSSKKYNDRISRAIKFHILVDKGSSGNFILQYTLPKVDSLHARVIIYSIDGENMGEYYLSGFLGYMHIFNSKLLEKKYIYEIHINGECVLVGQETITYSEDFPSKNNRH